MYSCSPSSAPLHISLRIKALFILAAIPRLPHKPKFKFQSPTKADMKVVFSVVLLALSIATVSAQGFSRCITSCADGTSETVICSGKCNATDQVCEGKFGRESVPGVAMCESNSGNRSVKCSSTACSKEPCTCGPRDCGEKRTRCGVLQCRNCPQRPCLLGVCSHPPNSPRHCCSNDNPCASGVCDMF